MASLPQRQRVAAYAVVLREHGDRVEVLLTTHDAGGVTELDIKMARFIDEAAKDMGVKS